MTTRDEIRTFDGAALVIQRMTAEITKYPPNSVSKREIVATVPLDGIDDARFDSLNACLTKLIYDEAKLAIKKNDGPFKTTPSAWLDELTLKAKAIADEC
jgi:hypothetical protein